MDYFMKTSLYLAVNHVFLFPVLSLVIISVSLENIHTGFLLVFRPVMIYYA